ncbi:hypothetical protein IYY11_21360 [Methylocystis sp. H62]|nr:hypothetical protein [Methylocystis sp. H62]
MANAQHTRIVSAQASPRQGPAGADPIFAAIAAMKRASTKYKAAEAEAELSATHDEAADAAGSAKFDAEFAVIDMTPTTRAGAIAQLRVLATLLDREMPADAVVVGTSETIRRALAVIEKNPR